MSRTTLREASGALASAQKPTAGVPAYLRWVNRPLGGRVAVVAAAAGGTPDQLTAISALLGLAGVAALLLAVPAAGPIACVLLLAGYVFDSADGQLARIQGRGGPAGEWLDHVVDGVRAPLVHIAVAVHLWRTGAPAWLIGVALLFSVLVSSWFLSQLLAEKLLAGRRGAAREEAGAWHALLRQPQDPSTTYLLLALIGTPAVFSPCYAAVAAWQLLVFAASLRRKRRQLAAS